MSFTGLFDRIPFPDQLRGHVVDPRGERRIHGYAVQTDLARNVGFVDLAWLAITGELPTTPQRAALTVALTWLAPLHVGDGPAHAAVLARIAGTPDKVLAGVAAVALGQLIDQELAMLPALQAWLDGEGEPPAAALGADPAYDAVVVESAAWFERPLPAQPTLTRVATAYALLLKLGVHEPLRLHALVTWARLPVVLAEAAYNRAGGVSTYPARLPDYQYVEGE